MFSAFGSTRLAHVGLAVAAFAVLVFVSILASADQPWPVIRMFGFLASVFLALLYLLAGFSGYWAPWRILWRRIPVLNLACFPDLNGVWYGMTRSNWPVVARLREAAAAEGALDPAELAKIEPVSGELAIEIRASLFGIAVRSSAGSAGGDPTTVTVRAQKNFETGNFELCYVFRQVTSDPRAAEESTHLGATMLETRPGPRASLEGSYWTRRNWREGMSTAGTISAKRVSDRHAPTTANLLEFAREQAVENLC